MNEEKKRGKKAEIVVAVIGAVAVVMAALIGIFPDIIKIFKPQVPGPTPKPTVTATARPTSTSLPTPSPTPVLTPTPPVDITTDQTLYDIETCEGKVKVDRDDSAYPFRKHPWLIESLKTCESERWWIIAWEIIGSERFCRHQIFISGEEEAKNKLKNGDLFAQKEIVFTPQDTNWYPEGQRDRCSQNRGDKAWTISLTPARNR